MGGIQPGRELDECTLTLLAQAKRMLAAISAILENSSCINLLQYKYSKTKPSVKEYATLADEISLSGLVLNLRYNNNVLLEAVKYDEADPVLFSAEFAHEGTAVAVSDTWNGTVYTAEYAVTVQDTTDVTTGATTDATTGATQKTE